MGKLTRGFRIVLEAALKFEFIQRIFEKQFGVKEIAENIEVSEEMITSELHPLESEAALLIRKKIRHILGSGIYHDWFENTTMYVTDDQVAIFGKSLFVRDWIANNYLNKLEDMLATKVNLQMNKTVN